MDFVIIYTCTVTVVQIDISYSQLNVSVSWRKYYLYVIYWCSGDFLLFFMCLANIASKRCHGKFGLGLSILPKIYLNKSICFSPQSFEVLKLCRVTSLCVCLSGLMMFWASCSDPSVVCECGCLNHMGSSLYLQCCYSFKRINFI